MIERFIYKVYPKYTMDTTTVKLHKSTKSILDKFKDKGESYDVVIKRLISNLKKINLKEELIEAYKSMSKNDLKILKEWENTSNEID